MKLLCIVIALGSGHAWFDNGHMLVAQIAKQQLEPSVASRFDDIVARWKDDFPGMSDLVSGSVWPDHIKCIFNNGICDNLPFSAMEQFSSWHFSDKIYNPDGLKLQVNPSAYFSEPSAPWLLVRAMQTFMYAKDPWAFNMMLRFAVHIVGDLHQPLHAANGYFNNSEIGQLLGGDAGGNLFLIEPPDTISSFRPPITNLHLLWDLAGGLYTVNWPYSEDQLSDLEFNATALQREFPRSIFEQYSPVGLDACADWTNPHATYYACAAIFKQWADEAHEVAVEEVYGHGIRQYVVPSAEYLANLQSVSKRQITLAGYRLADFLAIIVPRLPAQRATPLPTNLVSVPAPSVLQWQAASVTLGFLVVLLVCKVRSLQESLKKHALLAS